MQKPDQAKSASKDYDYKWSASGGDRICARCKHGPRHGITTCFYVSNLYGPDTMLCPGCHDECITLERDLTALRPKTHTCDCQTELALLQRQVSELTEAMAKLGSATVKNVEVSVPFAEPPPDYASLVSSDKPAC